MPDIFEEQETSSLHFNIEEILTDKQKISVKPDPIDENISNVIDSMGALVSGRQANSKAQHISFEILENSSILPDLHFVALNDIKANTENVNSFDEVEVEMPDDSLSQLYFAGLGILGLFALYKLMRETK